MSPVGRKRNVLVWHVHGSWTQALVAGDHSYLLPTTPGHGEYGRGLCGRRWPKASEVCAKDFADRDVDLVILQRPREIELAERWLGRKLGVDVPAVYVEHNAPRPYAVDSVHPIACRADIPLVHVTDFNKIMWDNGIAPTRVIAHGVEDPGALYSGEIPAAACMINEPVRRWRTVGADLLDELAEFSPIDVFGMGTEDLPATVRNGNRVTGRGDLPTERLMSEVARRAVYVHTARWTSLGLSLIEAMFLGMPIVALAATMAPLTVPPEAGVVSADVATLGYAVQAYTVDKPAATAAGAAARTFARTHFGLDRFLGEWDRLIEEVCA